MPKPSSMRTPSRRMTLGSMPSSTKPRNRRKSMYVGDAAGSNSKNANVSSASRRPPRSRASMIPRVGRENLVPPSPSGSVSSVTKSTAASRRRSVGGGGGSADYPPAHNGNRRQSLVPPSAPPVKADPRPISDKAFQQRCIKRLLSFLVESGYEYPISHKTLARPSAKDFNNIVSFLLRRVDPGFQTGTMKLEDEICLNFKNIGYPHTISKTSLVAAGSPHTWPALLSALTWLVEQIQCVRAETPSDDLHAENPFESLQELDQKTDKAFFQYVGQAYTAFLQNDNNMTEQLENAFANRFEKDDTFLENEVERVTDLNATIVERIKLLNQDTEALPTYAKKREDYATDLEQFHDLIRQMDDHKTSLQLKVQERTAELQETNAKLEKMSKHIQDLKEQIDSQTLSVDDVLKLESESKGLSEALDRVTVVKEERRKALLASEQALINYINQCEEAISPYNSKLLDLSSSLPEIAQAVSNLKASFDKEQMSDQKGILGVDLEGSFVKVAMSSKANVHDKRVTTKKEYQDELDQLESSHEAGKEAAGKNQIVQDKIAKCKETLKQGQETQEAKLSVRQREIEAIESKVDSLRDPIPLEEQMAAYERQCAELEALRAAHQEETVAKTRAVKQEIEVACKLMSEHEEHFRQKIAELEEYSRRKQDKAVEVSVPANIELED